MYRKEHKGINEVYHEVKFYTLFYTYFMSQTHNSHRNIIIYYNLILQFTQVATLFDDHPDLLDEFTRFLPDASAAASAHQASFLRQSYNRYDERSSAMAPLRHTQIDKVSSFLHLFTLCNLLLKGLNVYMFLATREER